MEKVRPKKSLGQHFLRDNAVAMRTASALSGEGCTSVLEIGPGMGILTRHLLGRNFADFRVVEIDGESVNYLLDEFGGNLNVISGDFLRLDIESLFAGTLAITGNFPYNISSQILFKVLENRNRVIELVGMFQKEVAERVCAGPGSKTYGILSVLIQAYYDADYLFTVSEKVFSPPPKVRSGVLRLKRNSTVSLRCDESLFFKVVKSCFNQRRKMLRNSVRASFSLRSEDFYMLSLRPEQLSVGQFIELTEWIAANRN